ncbi:MAG: SDR family NAD(P)-dependent oxidoreductase, partial [Pseudomonadota bacterium]
MSKTLLITGGASGIGAATAHRAAARGYKVAINYRSRDTQAKAIVADIEAKGGRAIALPGDMAREADIVRLFEETERALGPITHLVNSAGINGRRGRVDEYDAAVLANLFATNVIGLMLCCREAAKRMSTKHGGKGGGTMRDSAGQWGTIPGQEAGTFRQQGRGRRLHQGLCPRSRGRGHPGEFAAARHGADRDDRGEA